MIKKLIATVVLATAMSTAAFAQNQGTSQGMSMMNPMDPSTWMNWGGMTQGGAAPGTQINPIDPAFWAAFAHPDTHQQAEAGMMNPATWGQFMAPQFYMQMMNPATWMKWMDPNQYATFMDPKVWAYWMNPGSYMHMMNPNLYMQMMNPAAYMSMMGPMMQWMNPNAYQMTPEQMAATSDFINNMMAGVVPVPGAEAGAEGEAATATE